MKRLRRLPAALELYADNLYENYLFRMEATSVCKIASIYMRHLEKKKKEANIKEGIRNLIVKIARDVANSGDTSGGSNIPPGFNTGVSEADNKGTERNGISGENQPQQAQPKATASTNRNGGQSPAPVGQGSPVTPQPGPQLPQPPQQPGSGQRTTEQTQGQPSSTKEQSSNEQKPETQEGQGIQDESGNKETPTDKQPGGQAVPNVQQPQGQQGAQKKQDGAPAAKSLGEFGRLEERVSFNVNEFISGKFDLYGKNFETIKSLVESGDLDKLSAIDPDLAQGILLLQVLSRIGMEKVDEQVWKDDRQAKGLTALLFYNAYSSFREKTNDEQLNFDSFSQSFQETVRAAFEDDTITKKDLGTAFNAFLREQAARGVKYDSPQDAFSSFLSWVSDPNVSPWYKFALAIGAPLLLGGIFAAITSERPSAGLVLSLLGLVGVGVGMYGYFNRERLAAPPIKPLTKEEAATAVNDFNIKNNLGEGAPIDEMLDAGKENRQAIYGLVGGEQNFKTLVIGLDDEVLKRYMATLNDNSSIEAVLGIIRNTEYSVQSRFKIAKFILDNIISPIVDSGPPVSDPLGIAASVWSSITSSINSFREEAGSLANSNDVNKLNDFLNRFGEFINKNSKRLPQLMRQDRLENVTIRHIAQFIEQRKQQNQQKQ